MVSDPLEGLSGYYGAAVVLDYQSFNPYVNDATDMHTRYDQFVIWSNYNGGTRLSIQCLDSDPISRTDDWRTTAFTLDVTQGPMYGWTTAWRYSSATGNSPSGVNTLNYSASDGIALSDSAADAATFRAILAGATQIELLGGCATWASSSNAIGLRYDNLVITPLPEPASLSLLAVGGVMMLRRRRH